MPHVFPLGLLKQACLRASAAAGNLRRSGSQAPGAMPGRAHGVPCPQQLRQIKDAAPRRMIDAPKEHRHQGVRFVKILPFTGALAFGCLVSAACVAQTAPGVEINTGLQAGDFLIRARGVGIIPENLSSSVSLIGGKVAVTATPAPEVDFSYFLTDHIAFELIAASTRHEVSATGTALGHVDVGSV
jgi:hypothetical protein